MKPQLATTLQQLAGELRRQTFTAAQNFQRFVPFPTGFNQTTPCRRRRLHHRRTGRLHESRQGREICHCLRGRYYNLRSHREGQQKLESRDIERDRRHCQQNIVGMSCDLKRQPIHSMKSAI